MITLLYIWNHKCIWSSKSQVFELCSKLLHMADSLFKQVRKSQKSYSTISIRGW